MLLIILSCFEREGKPVRSILLDLKSVLNPRWPGLMEAGISAQLPSILPSRKKSRPRTGESLAGGARYLPRPAFTIQEVFW